MKRLLAFAPLVVFVALLGVFAWYNFHKQDHFEPRAMVGKPVPDIEITDLRDGSTASLKTLVAGEKHPVLVNVFASWCGPCIGESPGLMALKAKGVTLIGVAWKDRPQDTLNFLAQYGDPYSRTLSDPDGKLALALGISGVPETYIVAPDGTIIDKIGGPIVPETFDAVYAEVSGKK